MQEVGDLLSARKERITIWAIFERRHVFESREVGAVCGNLANKAEEPVRAGQQEVTEVCVFVLNDNSLVHVN